MSETIDTLKRELSSVEAEIKSVEETLHPLRVKRRELSQRIEEIKFGVKRGGIGIEVLTEYESKHSKKPRRGILVSYEMWPRVRLIKKDGTPSKTTVNFYSGIRPDKENGL